MSKLKKIPEFKNEKEEFEFWSTHDSTEYIDYPKAKRVLFSNLKPSTSVVSHKYLYHICHSCGGRNPEPKPLDSRFYGND
jgi:hypothetical protein